ncbi:hypothetical protein ACVNIS_09265 [Sphaerotilaceae bacterium SBD11-9]
MKRLQPLLRTVLPRTAPACAGRHRGFAARRGHARTQADGRPSTMVLLRRGAMARRQVPSMRLQVVPQITLLLQRVAPVATAQPHAATPLAAPGLRVERLLRSTERSTRLLQRERERERVMHTLHSTQLATVLREQATRTESSTRVEQASAYPPVAVRVPLRVQTAAAPHGTPPQAAPHEPPATMLRQPTPQPSHPPAEPLAPRELARVTDHVLAQLDTRVLSWRERHGQV